MEFEKGIDSEDWNDETRWRNKEICKQFLLLHPFGSFALFMGYLGNKFFERKFYRLDKVRMNNILYNDRRLTKFLYQVLNEKVFSFHLHILVYIKIIQF